MNERERLFLIARGFDLAKDVVRYLLYGWVAWMAVLAARALAGKTTDASFVFEYVFSKENDYGLPWILVSVVILWAIAERKLRHKKTAILTARTKELELRLDPQRSSSGLASSGETHPRDRLA